MTTTRVMKDIDRLDALAAEDLAPFVDAAGHLDLRIEGADPSAVFGALRRAGFERVHTWVEPRDRAASVQLRVTARRSAARPAVERTERTARRTRQRPVAAHWAAVFAGLLVGARDAGDR